MSDALRVVVDVIHNADLKPLLQAGPAHPGLATEDGPRRRAYDSTPLFFEGNPLMAWQGAILQEGVHNIAEQP